uniref:Glycosyl transferase CAP10 domain-containing protein n=1 Tax=Pyramimonas obovata TaxID=1411642 RepID=A0A7S0WWC6_9CHLO
MRSDDLAAQQMAQRGTELMGQLTMDGVCRYVAEVLTEYSRLQRFTVVRDPLASPINCEDDLWHRYRLDGRWNDEDYLTHDRSLCVDPSEADGVPPPGLDAIGRWEVDPCYHQTLPRFVPPGARIDDLPQMHDGFGGELYPGCRNVTNTSQPYNMPFGRPIVPL